jgi:uncharacterized SAM-binding protein YcdF (DUF218 family)
LTSRHDTDKLDALDYQRLKRMSLAWTLKAIISTLLLPPGNSLLLLCLAGLFRRRRWAFGLALVSTALLLAECTPAVAGFLIASLENRTVALAPDPAKPAAGAIVILGSGLSTDAQEYGGDTLNERTLIRTRYGAVLARHYALPVLVTGGRLPNTERSEAEIMATVLNQEFGVKARWQEEASMDTAENAAYSARILKAAGISRVVLVTHAFHMPRAQRLFEQAGLEVVPAPTAFFSHRRFDWLASDFMPQVNALHISYYAQHEWLGLAWTALTH